MILAEEEAKTKWCPEARILPNAPGYGAGNRFAEDPHPIFMAETRCIGSACMAWRWFGMKIAADGSIYTTTEAYRTACGIDPLPPKFKDVAVAVGYCGKAGKP